MSDPVVIGGEVGAIIGAVMAALYGADKVLNRISRKQEHAAPKNGNGKSLGKDYMTRELCEERHKNLSQSLQDIKASITSMHTKIDKLAE